MSQPNKTWKQENGLKMPNFEMAGTYLSNENLQFDFSFGTGLNDTMNYISIGCSWLINKE